MLEQEQFNEIRLVSVGKDEEKIKSRIKEIWLKLPKPQREEILNLSGLTVHAVTRSYQKGKLSLKLALSMAQILKLNPNYLTGASDEREGFSTEAINQFLTDNGHAALNTGNEKPRRKYNRKPKPVPNENDEAEPYAAEVADESEAVVEEPAGTISDTTAPVEVAQDDEAEKADAEDEPANANIAQTAVTPAEEPQGTAFDSLLAALHDKVCALTEDGQEKLISMPAETAEQLLKSLYLRSEYSEDVKNLSILVKLLLVL